MKAIKRLFLLGVYTCLLSGVSAVFAQQNQNGKKINIGIEYGVNYRTYSSNHVRPGGVNYTRLMFGKGDGSYFFLQQENGAFNVEEGSAISTGYESAQGIGMKFLMPLDGYNVYFVPVIGTSSVRVNNYNYSSDSTSDYVKGVEHTGPFSQIGFLYEYAENNVFASFGLSYRVLTLGNPIELKGSDAAATDRSKRVKDLNSLDLSLGVGLVF